jgi:tRNA1(Val) A37 N6-methylase TrmN6
VRGHRWSLDDLVTAWFAAEVVGNFPPARFADLGCGIGAVLLLLAWRFPAAGGVGVEAQSVSVGLARRSLAWNGAAGRCEVRRADLRDPASIPEGAAFDLVTATPPYLPVGSAHGSSRMQWSGCHLELRGGVEEYCEAAARLLAPDGWFVTCAGAMQDERVRRGARRAGMHVVRRRGVVPRSGKRPLFAVWAMSHQARAATAEAPLVVRDRDGRWTDAFLVVRAAMGMPA